MPFYNFFPMEKADHHLQRIPLAGMTRVAGATKGPSIQIQQQNRWGQPRQTLYNINNQEQCRIFLGKYPQNERSVLLLQSREAPQNPSYFQ